MAEKTGKLGVGRVAIATGATLAILFIGCWLGSQVDFPASHRFVDLFTAYPTRSWVALGQGTFEAVIGGLVGGLLWSLIYNAVSFGKG